MKLLEVQGLEKHFGGLLATDGVDFQVDKGEIVGLIGPNGAGKTTLFNLISGTVSPDSGRIFFQNKNIARNKPHQICRAGIARTFQSVKIFPRQSVRNHLIVGFLFGDQNRKPPEAMRKAANELLNFVGLAGKEDLPAGDLTLANQKRVEVARALATNPALLLLDEVMAGLNPTEVIEAMDLVRRIRERGITVLLIEHVMKAIMNICDRVIVLHYGKKLAEGRPEEVAQDKTVREVYLGE